MFHILVAIGMHGKNWKKVQEHVGTRNRTQIRSHAQKYFNSEINNISFSPHRNSKLISNDKAKAADGSLKIPYTFLKEFM